MDQDQDQDQDSSPPAPQGGGSPPGGPPAEDAFDIWLQRSLHQLYDSVTTEPIPPELLRLIAEDRNRRSG